MALSGCVLVLISGPGSASMLAGAGRHASAVSGLQMELGEGPCLLAHATGIPVFLPDMTAEDANRWPWDRAVSERWTCAVTGRGCWTRSIWRMPW